MATERTFTAAEMLQNAEMLVGGLDQHGCYLGNPLYLTEAAAMLRQAAAASEREAALREGIERVYKLAADAQNNGLNQTLTRLAFGKMAIELNGLLQLGLSPTEPTP